MKYLFNNIIGNSFLIVFVKWKVSCLVKSDYIVLIIGENGMGKEVFV